VDTSNQPLPFTTTDGTFTNVKTLPGDLNADGMVDINDAILAANAFGSMNGDKNWNPAADMDTNGTIDIFDLIIIAQNFGRKL
jgi:endo-1,4-beta-xylanase